MVKYGYQYIINPKNNPEGYRLLTIIVDSNTVAMFLSIDEPDHKPLIELIESDITYLENYVNILGDNPNAPFVLDELLLNINKK